MKKLLRRLIVFAGVLGLLMALNVGMASAHPDNAPFGNSPDPAPGFAPVGSHIVSPDAPGHPGADNGFGRIHNPDGSHSTNFENPAIIGLSQNPNCPLHYPHP